MSVQEVTEIARAGRKDFNREISSLERFMKKGNETPIENKAGLKITKWEKRETYLKFQQKERNKAKAREKANVSTEKGTMGNIQKNSLQPATFSFEKKDTRNWNKFKAGLEKQISSNYNKEKLAIYRDNLNKAIDEQFLIENHRRLLKNLWDNVEDEEMLQAGFDNPNLMIDFNYDEHDENVRFETVFNDLIEYIANLKG
jgi:hypothetical protein